MRILITGAAGFVGSHLTDRLIQDGHEILGVDNFLTGRRENLAHLVRHPSFRLLESDVALHLAIEGPLDWILHFASPASPPKYLRYPLETMRANAEGTRHLLELALTKQSGFLLASTSEVYGDPEVHPQTESYLGNVNSVGPRGVYDEGKRFAEALVAAYRRRYGLSTRIVRIFNTYGPRMDPQDGRVVSNFACRALDGEPLVIYGKGNQTRSFQYVDDLVEGVVRLMRVDYPQPLNLGNPGEFTILQLADLVRELAGSRSKIVFEPLPEDDPKRRRPDIGRAKKILDWEPKVELRHGLEKTLDYFRACRR